MTDRNFDAFADGLDYPMFVVTTVDPLTAARAGCLVGFATQCSVDPARLLVCLSRNNHTFRVASRADLLAVHALPAGAHDLAALFGEHTGDEVDKFARCAWTAGPGGVPLLDRCPRRLVGRVDDRVDLGDHVGFVLTPVAVDGPRPPREPALTFAAVRDLRAAHPA